MGLLEGRAYSSDMAASSGYIWRGVAATNEAKHPALSSRRRMGSCHAMVPGRLSSFTQPAAPLNADSPFINNRGRDGYASKGDRRPGEGIQFGPL